MKKTRILIAAITLASVAYGQKDSAIVRTGFYAGPRAIPQASWMVNKNDMRTPGYRNTTQMGSAFGLLAGYNTRERKGGEIGVLYSSEGKQYRLNGREFTQRLNYIKTSLQFVYTSKPSALMLVGKLGPQLSILSAAKIDPGSVDGHIVTDSRDQFENTVLGGVANIGGRYFIDNGLWLDATLRYDVNFSIVENNRYKYYPVGRADTYNMTAGLEIGINYLIR